jgi:hypothetical protein
MVSSFVLRLSMQHFPGIRQNPPPCLTEFARRKKSQSSGFPQKMVDTSRAAGLFAYAPGEFLSLERGFHQLKNRVSSH